MSIRSVREKIQRGVIKRHHEVCFPVAVEMASPQHRLPDVLYPEYRSLGKRLGYGVPAPEYESEYENYIGRMVRHLGGLSIEDVVFKQIKTAKQFAKIVTRLLEEDYCVTATIVCQDTELHSVGVKFAEEDSFRAIGIVVPRQVRGIVSAERFSDFLVLDDISPNKYPIAASNIMAIPPAA